MTDKQNSLHIGSMEVFVDTSGDGLDQRNQSEIAWLIEENMDALIGPNWFVGGPTNAVEFSNDPNRAMRFSRRRDAQAMLDFLRCHNKLWCVDGNVGHYFKVTEHMWVDYKPKAVAGDN